MEIKEMESLTKIKAHTLRYYESIGLIQGIERDESGKRNYREQDVAWIQMLVRLRATHMPIGKMKEYARLRYLGDETANERRALLETHLAEINSEIQKLLDVKAYVEGKIDIYKRMECKQNGKDEI